MLAFGVNGVSTFKLAEWQHEGYVLSSHTGNNLIAVLVLLVKFKHELRLCLFGLLVFELIISVEMCWKVN